MVNKWQIIPPRVAKLSRRLLDRGREGTIPGRHAPRPPPLALLMYAREGRRRAWLRRAATAVRQPKRSPERAGAPPRGLPPASLPAIAPPQGSPATTRGRRRWVGFECNCAGADKSIWRPASRHWKAPGQDPAPPPDPFGRQGTAARSVDGRSRHSRAGRDATSSNAAAGARWRPPRRPRSGGPREGARRAPVRHGYIWTGPSNLLIAKSNSAHKAVNLRLLINAISIHGT